MRLIGASGSELILHTSDVLNLSRDTAGDVHLGVNGNTCLTNLTVVIQPACVNSSTATTNLTMQHLSELEQLVEVLLAAHTITTGYNDRCTLQVVLGSLHVVVQHLYDESLTGLTMVATMLPPKAGRI